MRTRLTTKDNPYNPFTEWDKWLNYDMNHYNCSAYLARVAMINDDSMSQEEIDEETERAIDEIIANDFLNVYKKVVEETENNS